MFYFDTGSYFSVQPETFIHSHIFHRNSNTRPLSYSFHPTMLGLTLAVLTLCSFENSFHKHHATEFVMKHQDYSVPIDYSHMCNMSNGQVIPFEKSLILVSDGL